MNQIHTFGWLASAIISVLLLTTCKAQNQVTVLRNLKYGSYALNQVDLYLPVQKRPSQPLPLLIYIHGGGWMEGTKDSCPGELVAQREYAMACINYRLSDQAVFPAQIYDVKRAVRWLRSNAAKYNLDPNRFGAWGPSAGGHLSALLGTSAGVQSLEKEQANQQISSAVQAVCSWYGPTDFTQVPPAFNEAVSPSVFKQYKDAPWFTYTVATTQLLGGPVAEHPELATLANPITYVDSEDPPFLIVHGELDKIVPVNQSVLLAKALQEHGVEVTFVRDPNLRHSYAGSNGEAFDPKLIDMAINFFNIYLKSHK